MDGRRQASKLVRQVAWNGSFEALASDSPFNCWSRRAFLPMNRQRRISMTQILQPQPRESGPSVGQVDVDAPHGVHEIASIRRRVLAAIVDWTIGTIISAALGFFVGNFTFVCSCQYEFDWQGTNHRRRLRWFDCVVLAGHRRVGGDADSTVDFRLSDGIARDNPRAW